MTLEESIQAVEDSISALKQFLIDEKLLIPNPDDASGALVQNQSPEDIEAYNARRFMDIRF